jgi:hypothetical protein
LLVALLVILLVILLGAVWRRGRVSLAILINVLRTAGVGAVSAGLAVVTFWGATRALRVLAWWWAGVIAIVGLTLGWAVVLLLLLSTGIVPVVSGLDELVHGVDAAAGHDGCLDESHSED